MSSTHSIPSSSSEPKKKFGKNLNKLTKPPPPSLSSTTSSSLRLGASGSALSSRNGLHLLSTKRSNSFTSTLSGGGGSLLGSKTKQPSSANTAPRPLNTPSLRSESSNDALLSSSGSASAGSGLSGWRSVNTTELGSTASSQTAWGMGEKLSQQVTQTSTALAPKGRVSAGYHHSSANISQSNSLSQQRKDPSEAIRIHRERDAAPRQRIDRSFNDRRTADSGIPEDISREPSKNNQKTYLKNDVNLQYPTFTLNRKPDPHTLFKEDVGDSTYAYKPEQNSTSGEGNDMNISNGHRFTNDSINNPNDSISLKTSKPPPSSDENKNASSSRKDAAVSGDMGDQALYMNRRARERAEERRAEEQARINEQKERAARRLKELEEKLSQGNSNVGSTEDLAQIDKRNSKGNWRTPRIGRMELDLAKNNPSTEIILDRLVHTNEHKLTAGGVKNPNEPMNPSNGNSKNIIDPNRTYSSLVGGGVSHKSSQRTPSPPPIVKISLPNSTNDQFPIIHLNSYEDRDRGQRNTSSGPRMLFDPKSGSMIHAPSVDKRSMHYYSDDNPAGGRGRKDRSKQKSRGRDRDYKPENGSSVFSKRSDTNHSMSLSGEDTIRRRKQSDELDEGLEMKGARRNRKKEDSNGYRKDRKRAEREAKYNQGHVDQSDFIGHVASRKELAFDDNQASLQTSTKRYGNRPNQARHTLPNASVKMPRTRGVLYKVDERGNYVCADGCEADQGYGAHSVPGGRIRNPTAHAEFLGRYQRLNQTASAMSIQQNNYHRHPMGERKYTQNSYSNSSTNENFHQSQSFTNNQAHNGYDFNVDDYNPNPYFRNASTRSSSFGNKNQDRFDQNSSSYSNNKKENNDETNENYELPAELRVKANEKLSILSGVPDSPELQATAHPWAPSEAALAAAAANSSTKVDSLHNESNDNSESSRNVTAEMMRILDESDDGSSTSVLGLGFDPTENMDTMMMSPSIDAPDINGDISKITHLSLEPTKSKVNSNPFAPLGSPNRYLGSSTWGTSGSLTGSSGVDPIGSLSIGALNWDMLGTQNRDSSSLAQQGSAIRDLEHLNSPSTFLSLSTNQGGDTWGTSLTGLGDHTQSTQPSNNGSSRTE